MALVVWYMEHTAIKGRGGQLASEPADMPWGVRAFDLVDSGRVPADDFVGDVGWLGSDLPACLHEGLFAGVDVEVLHQAVLLLVKTTVESL